MTYRRLPSGASRGWAYRLRIEECSIRSNPAVSRSGNLQALGQSAERASAMGQPSLEVVAEDCVDRTAATSEDARHPFRAVDEWVAVALE